MFRAAIFDLDGVITDTASYHFRAWQAMAASIGIAIDQAFNENLKGIGRMESLERILVYGGVADRFSAADRERLAAEKNDAYVTSLAALSEADILPGIKPLLLDLRSSGVRIGLASASRNAEMILAALRIRDLVEAIADPTGLRGKPAPDLFLKAARLLGVEPRECIGIEDAVAGIASIDAAGMMSVGIGDVELLTHAGANIALPSTAELSLSVLADAWDARPPLRTP